MTLQPVPPSRMSKEPLTTRQIHAEIHRRSAERSASEQRALERQEASFRIDGIRGTLPPPPVRWVRGEVERTVETIRDFNGRERVAMPYRAIDTLETLERRRTITRAMHRAGDKFHADFITAGLDSLRIPSLVRIAGGGRAPQLTNSQVEARDEVWWALLALGGHRAPGALCIWYVVGLEHPIQDWATRCGWAGRPINRTVATGILVGALGVLQALYKIEDVAK